MLSSSDVIKYCAEKRRESRREAMMTDEGMCTNRVEVPYDFGKCKQTKALFFDGIECENKWEFSGEYEKGDESTKDGYFLLKDCPFVDKIEFIPNALYGMRCETSGVRWKIDESNKYEGQVQKAAIKVICDSINEYLQKNKATFFVLRRFEIRTENDSEETMICRFWHGNLKGEEKGPEGDIESKDCLMKIME